MGLLSSPSIDGKSGALLKMPTGILMRGNAGAIASLPYVPDSARATDDGRARAMRQKFPAEVQAKTDRREDYTRC